jgi:hypothetical protein
MSDIIAWTWNGPLNSSARLLDFGASHVATLSLSYPPSTEARRIICNRAARAVADVLLTVAAGGPAVERYRRIASAQAETNIRGVALADRHRVLRQEQEDAGVVDDPSLAKRLVSLARESRDIEVQQQAVTEEIAALQVAMDRARSEAEEELARQARQQVDVACRTLEARRSAELTVLLDEIGERLTALLALDEAIQHARSGACMRPSLDLLPSGSMSPNQASI